MVRRSSSEQPDLNGLLVIDKPVGLTSHDVVARVRRMTGMKRVGHAGTLDPFATGLLVVAVGRATRLLQFVQDTDKGYVAGISLGVETDSCDVDGAVIRRLPLDLWPDRPAVEACLATFTGTIDQVPPIYSAIKIGGQKLYELARAGTSVDVSMRQVMIHNIELLHYEPPQLSIGVWCGKGTYIRSLARDIGEALGTTAYCHALRRTNTGRFCLANAWTLDELADLNLRERWPEIALAPDAAVQTLPSVVLGEADARSWYHGRSVHVVFEPPPTPVMHRIYAADGSFMGVGETDQYRGLRPSVVFPAMVAEGHMDVAEEFAVDGSVTDEDNIR